MGVAFCLAEGAFLGFGNVIVGLCMVGPGERFLVGGGDVKGRGWRGWRGRGMVEGVRGGDDAEGDREETGEDDRGESVVVVVLGLGLAVVVVAVIVLVIAKVIVIVLIVILVVLVLALVGHVLEGPSRLEAPGVRNLGLNECTEPFLGGIGRAKGVGFVPDKVLWQWGIAYGSAILAEPRAECETPEPVDEPKLVV